MAKLVDIATQIATLVALAGIAYKGYKYFFGSNAAGEKGSSSAVERLGDWALAALIVYLITNFASVKLLGQNLLTLLNSIILGG